MAIILTSPERKQRTLLWIISAFFTLLLLAISFIVFLPEFTNELPKIPEGVIFRAPSVKINFSIIDSEQVKNLEPFLLIETEFTYAAQDKNGKQVTGKISATSRDKAQKILEEAGLKIIEIKETLVGRSEPFYPYYQTTTQTSTATPKK